MAIEAVTKYSSAPRNIIVWSLVAFVYAEVTLRLRDAAVVYGQPFALVCFTTVNASSQYATFYRYLDPNSVGDLVAYITFNGSGFCYPSPTTFPNYTYGCNNDGKEITLNVSGDNLNEHDTSWRCTNRGGTVLANNNKVSVFVNDPVRNVTIENNTVVNVIEGISETFVCESSPCRPSAEIYWMKNGINITDLQVNSSIHQSGTKNITKSNLWFTAVKGDNGSLLACGAYNGYGIRKLSANVIIIVHYPPVVNNFASPLKVIQGQPLEIVCTADGNPSPQLTWNPAGEDNINMSRLYYAAISRDKAVNHTCTARNTMVPTTGNQQTRSDSKQLLIDVLYSPLVNNFTSPLKVIQGQPLVVVCSADGNPPPQLTWNPVGEDKVNKSRLYYSAISRDKAVNHTCTATNDMVPTTGSPQTGSDSKQLLIDVLYSPIVNNFTLPVVVIEGQPLVVVCIADGNPPPQMTWNPVGEDKVNGSRLYYSAISRDKSVIHTCTATNNMVPTTGSPQTGSDSKEFLINVLYNASISKFTSKDNISVLNENSSLQILCQIDSNPNAVISLYFETDLKSEKENALNLSYTKTATCLDAGKYTCIARNEIMNGDAVFRSIHINVTCYPRLDHRRNISTEHYRPLGDNLTLEVYVIAYPVPTDITWYHREKETDMWQMFPYQSPSSSGLYSSIMVHLASEREFRYYMVNMSNGFGIYNNTYRIIPESIPGVPTNFTITVNGPDSVTLEWMPGFWGGHPQEFIIWYRIFPDGAWVKLDQIKDSGSSKQTATITGLQQKTTYEFHLYAENIKGHSANTSVIVATTEMNDSAFPVGAVAGSISGALVAGVCVIVIIFLRRRGQRSKRKDDDLGRELKEKERPESGLVDNLVYDSSDPKPNPSTSSGAATTEYAVVKKKAVLIENSIYAQVQKKKEKKKNGAAKGKPGKTSRGDIYENADIVGRSPSKDNVYANSNNEKASGDNVYENPGAAASYGPMSSKDGLLYADLKLDPPTEKNGKPIIRGIENCTEYADIEYGKRGEPLLDGEKEKNE